MSRELVKVEVYLMPIRLRLIREVIPLLGWAGIRIELPGEAIFLYFFSHSRPCSAPSNSGESSFFSI